MSSRFNSLGRGALGAALLALWLPFAAEAKPITGKLSKPGFTVLAIEPTGETVSDRAPKSRFRIESPGARVALHLRAPDGTYAGPIVVGSARKGKRAILGVKDGAKLGPIKIKRTKGYARPEEALDDKWVDDERRSRAKDGVPTGAGLFGRVRSRPPRNAAVGDQDFDGIPDSLDIDDDGDLVLDHFERPAASTIAGRARVAQQGSPLGLHAFVNAPNPAEVVNANARDSGDPGMPAFSDAEIDANLAEKGDLVIGVLGGGPAELDCRGLSYCSFPGTGRAGHPDAPPPSQLAAFPGPPGNEYFDPDGDGFGSLTPFGPGPPLVHLAHGATTAAIKTGDLLIERVGDGEEQEFPATVPEVLATQSTLASFDDGAGHARAVGYPDVRPGDGPPGFPIADGGDGILDLIVRVWRPQRPPGPGEPGFGQPGAWIDAGRLNYSLSIGTDPGNPSIPCPQASLSTTDPELAPISVPGQGGGFTDLAPDRPAHPDNALTYSVNISQCIAELNAVSPGSISWPDGESRLLSFGARDSGNRIATGVYFWFKRN